jgi:hypothetical protein
MSKPINMRAHDVRALLDGRKTQTRLAAKFVKPQGDKWHVCNAHGGLVGCTDGDVRSFAADYAPYAPGDRLWVREAWRVGAQDDKRKPRELAPQYVGYEADCTGNTIPATGRYRHACFMPRWASRLTLIVTDVRVQRVQEISEEDAEAEGIETDIWDHAPAARDYSAPDMWFVNWIMCEPHTYSETPDVDSFRTLWNSIHGPCAWDRNDWVCALTFTVHRANIDAAKKDQRE